MVSIRCVLRRASANAMKTGHDKKYLLSARVCRAARSFNSSSDIGSNSWVIAAICSGPISTPILLLYVTDRDENWWPTSCAKPRPNYSSAHSTIVCVPHVEHGYLTHVVDMGDRVIQNTNSQTLFEI